MNIKLPCELISVVPASFKDSEGQVVEYYKALFLSEGEVFDVNFKGDERFEFLKERERKLLEYTFLLIKNKFGSFDIKLPIA